MNYSASNSHSFNLFIVKNFDLSWTSLSYLAQWMSFWVIGIVRSGYGGRNHSFGAQRIRSQCSSVPISRPRIVRRMNLFMLTPIFGEAFLQRIKSLTIMTEKKISTSQIELANRWNQTNLWAKVGAVLNGELDASRTSKLWRLSTVWRIANDFRHSLIFL